VSCVEMNQSAIFIKQQIQTIFLWIFLLPPSYSWTTSGSHRTILKMSSSDLSPWKVEDIDQGKEAKSKLDIWPLDEHNTILLNEVHPRNYQNSSEPHDLYDLIAIGAGAGGLVSSKQSARRGAKSCMISEDKAGGDCLNVGCVPSKALISAAKAIQKVRRAANFGVIVPDGEIKIDFSAVMQRMRRLRAKISPADGHDATTGTGAHVFQGRGRFVGKDEIEVNGQRLRFKKAVIATGGRPAVPSDIPGLLNSPYTTNEILFNLETLPPRMIILGAGVIALEMAQTFAAFGTKVTLIQRSNRLFQSKGGDPEAAELLKKLLEKDGVEFVQGKVNQVKTLRERSDNDTSVLPLMSVNISTESNAETQLDCECLLVATGRIPNIEDLGLESAGVDYKLGDAGIIVNDLAQSTSNPNVYAVGDCVANVPRLTHMAGEMAKLVVQNSLFNDSWRLSSLVVPACMYTEPEYAIVGINSEEIAIKNSIEVDVYRAGLENNDRGILEDSNVGFCKIITKKGTDKILGATIVAERAGEMINEVSLAIKNGIGLEGIGRNIHSYPTTGEAVMGCGIQYINANAARLD